MINKELVQNLLINFPSPWNKYTVVSVTDCSQGVDQQVKIIQLKNNKDLKKVVVKYPKQEPDKILHERIGCLYSAEQGVPVPNIIYYDNKYLVESYIQGKCMKKIITSTKKYKNIYKQMGKYLKSIHLNTGTGFGKIKCQKLVGQHKNKQFLRINLKDEMQTLKKSQYYSQNYIRKIQKYLQENQDIINKKQNVTSLIHGDYIEDNLLGTKECITGVIDFGDLAMGNPMQDFARLFISHFGTYKWESIIQGYGNYNLKQIRFYTIALCLWQVNSLVQRKQVRIKLRKLQKAMRLIIG